MSVYVLCQNHNPGESDVEERICKYILKWLCILGAYKIREQAPIEKMLGVSEMSIQSTESKMHSNQKNSYQCTYQVLNNILRDIIIFG